MFAKISPLLFVILAGQAAAQDNPLLARAVSATELTDAIRIEIAPSEVQSCAELVITSYNLPAVLKDGSPVLPFARYGIIPRCSVNAGLDQGQLTEARVD